MVSERQFQNFLFFFPHRGRFRHCNCYSSPNASKKEQLVSHSRAVLYAACAKHRAGLKMASSQGEARRPALPGQAAAVYSGRPVCIDSQSHVVGISGGFANEVNKLATCSETLLHVRGLIYNFFYLDPSGRGLAPGNSTEWLARL